VVDAPRVFALREVVAVGACARWPLGWRDAGSASLEGNVGVPRRGRPPLLRGLALSLSAAKRRWPRRSVSVDRSQFKWVTLLLHEEISRPESDVPSTRAASAQHLNL